MKNRELDWNICKEIVASYPGYEHTEIIESDDLINNDDYYTYTFGKKDVNRPLGGIVQAKRDIDGNLKITTAKKLCHSLTVASTGSGKTQGIILNTAFNADPRMSYVFLDPKGEITQASYNRMVELYGKENVIVANFMQPQHSMAKFNCFTPLAYRWIESKKSKNKEKLREEILSELRNITDILFPTFAQRDPTWEEVAKKFIFGIIVGLFEDLDETEEKDSNYKVYPEMINFETLSKIIFSISGISEYCDGGFFVNRDKNSRSYQYAKTVIENASNTRLNYIGFINEHINRYTDPKILDISMYNNLDITDLSKKPKVLYVIYDISDRLVKEYMNFVISQMLCELRRYSVKNSKPLDVPVMFVCDEFASLQPHSIYPDIIATGRGIGIFMQMVIQSYSQLEARYPEDYHTIKQNCDINVFLGSNCVKTVEAFSDEMGKTTSLDPTSFLNGHINTYTHNVVTQDYLLHKMKPQEAYVTVNKNEPLHTSFQFYYKTPEYTKYKKMDPMTFNVKEEKIKKERYEYNFPEDKYDVEGIYRRRLRMI